uniref:ADAM10 endopeptidase n=1 Tax=Panagrellus redivivus TaxID=6233 RepID=A0A7E4ZT23_PANRE
MTHRLRRVTLLACLLLVIDYAVALNKYVDNYETLNYRPILDRRKRSAEDPNLAPGTVDLRFRSHNRTFNLRLTPIEREAVFGDDHELDVNGVFVRDHVPEDYLYEGYIKDDPGSHAYGSIMDGLFDGHIILSDGTSLTVEKAARYFDVDSRPKNYHSIIYLDDKINHDKYRPKRHIHEANDDAHDGCGLTRTVRRHMEMFQNSGDQMDDPSAYSHKPESEPKTTPFNREFHNSYFGELAANRSQERSKRSFKATLINGRTIHPVRTCAIYMQADQKLFEHIFNKEGNRDPVRTREEIVALFYNHIKAVNSIYETTNFGGITGLNFVIQRTTIYTRETCINGAPAPGSDNPFCEENVDVSNYLNFNSQRNHSAFCLAYALTFRDFVGGTLGLAWVASPNFNTAGGICQVYQKYNEGSRGMVYRSLNTGIVTLVNYGNRVPTRVSQLTLAHEIGHNFGSPHDYPAECQPGLPDGNFIMFASATSGDKVNNARFSSCSISNISTVLFEVLSQSPVTSTSPQFGRKRNCFQARTSAFCGNQIKEPGEECDCGFSDVDCRLLADQCCNPHEVNGRYNSATACRRVSGARCSPSEGQCCNAGTCSFFAATERKMCLQETECTYQQYCNGSGAECPDPMPKRDGLSCQDATKVCQSGACNGSICAEVGLKDCFLTEGQPDKLCHLACEKDGKCLSSFELPEFRSGRFNQSGREGKPGLLLHPGSPCNDYKGYCDIFRKCRSVDSNGPLARLKNLLFNKHTIKTVSQWAHEHWWACVLMSIGGLLFMALFVKCCAVHTPSTNPNKAPAAHFTDTLRHPSTLLRRGRHARLQQNAPAQPPPGAARGGPAPPPNAQPAPRPHRHQRRAAAAAAARAQQAPQPAAPPLISPVPPPPGPPPSAPIVEPPPPYSATDPASPAVPASNPASSSMPAVLIGNGPALAPAVLPGAPAPPPPPLSTLPIVPGQGPKPGRRRQKPPANPEPPKSKSNKRSAK